jgi:hypothetical protein
MCRTAAVHPGPHILMIANHGVHEWEVTPGLPDTGGQNVYVNQFTDALIEQGYRVTIVTSWPWKGLTTTSRMTSPRAPTAWSAGGGGAWVTYPCG